MSYWLSWKQLLCYSTQNSHWASRAALFSLSVVPKWCRLMSLWEMTKAIKTMKSTGVSFKDIVFCLPFLHCCPFSLSFQTSLYHVWTPAQSMKRMSYHDNKTLWILIWFSCASQIDKGRIRFNVLSIQRIQESLADLFASRGRPLRFHRLCLLFTGRLGSFALFLLNWQWRVTGGTCAFAVFGGIWKGKLQLFFFHMMDLPTSDSKGHKHLLVPFSSFLRLDSWLVSRSLTAWS